MYCSADSFHNCIMVEVVIEVGSGDAENSLSKLSFLKEFSLSLGPTSCSYEEVVIFSLLFHHKHTSS